MPAEDDGEEVGECGADHQSLCQPRGFVQIIVERDDEYEHLEDSHGDAGDIAERRAEAHQQVDQHRVERQWKHFLMLAGALSTFVEELAVRVCRTTCLHFDFNYDRQNGRIFILGFRR